MCLFPNDITKPGTKFAPKVEILLMKKLLPALLLFFSFSSCVTTFIHSNYTGVKIIVPKNAEVTYHKKNDDAEINIHFLPEEVVNYMPATKAIDITAKRSKTEQLQVVVKKGATERTVNIKPIHSWLYYANIYSFLGLGFLVDCKNPNRFTYPQLVYINMEDTSKTAYVTHKPFLQNKYELVINPPVANISIMRYNYVLPSGTPLALVAAFNYHYNNSNFFSIEAGAAVASRKHNIYTPDNISSYYFAYPSEHKTAQYFNLTHNHVFHRFNIGYGISAGRHTATRYFARYRMADTAIYSADYLSLGAVASAHYRLSNRIYFGISYQPQIIAKEQTTKILYEHILNFGFSWRFHLLKYT